MIPQIHPANDIECPTPASVRRDAAKRDVRAAFHRDWMKLCAEQAEAEAEIDRKFWAGGFN